ncbi:MAG: riboflavin kinase, partial [bacterium]|nr:riboflavin kinase [bacterium]
NWTFGAGGAGDAAFLRARGFRVEVVPFAICGETPVSSTRIRAAVASGDLDLAAAMLGRPWALEGEVFAGKGVGHTLGFPTLNVRPATGLVRPPCGVYAVETAWGRGAANYGLAPTMGARAWAEPVLEVHLLEVPAAGLPPLRGRTVAVDMQRFLRPERHFASVAELQAQIARDLAAARA